MKITPQIKLYITIAIIVAIFIAIIIGTILPLIKKIDDIAKQYLNTSQQIVDAVEKRNQISKIEQEFNEIKDSIFKINSSLADSSKFLDVLIKLEQLAESQGNRHEISILEAPKKDSSQFKYLFFRIILKGSFNSVMNFINQLENADFYSKIEKIEITKPSQNVQEATPAGDIKATLEVKIFTH